MQLFSVMFYVGTDLHKLDSRLVTNETTNKYQPVERRQRSERDSPVVASVRDSPKPSRSTAFS